MAILGPSPRGSSLIFDRNASKRYGPCVSRDAPMQFLVALLIIAGIAVLPIVHDAEAEGNHQGQFANGAYLLRECVNPHPEDQTYCIGYISGAADAYNDNGNIRNCPPPNMSTGAAVTAAITFLKENPNQLYLPASTLVARSLAKAFPCER